MAKRSSRIQQSKLDPLGAIRNWPSVEAKNWATRQIPVLCQASQVCAVVLFGSIVRDVTAATDLDVLYIYEGVAPAHERPPIDIDLRKFERSEVEHLLRSGNDLLSWCVRFGKVVCDHNEYWSNLVEKWKPSIGLPSAEVALQRARKSAKLLTDIDLLGDFDAAIELYLSLLTHLARAKLIDQGVYPASRPELSEQLSQIGQTRLADYLRDAIVERNAVVHSIAHQRRPIWREFLRELDSYALTSKVA